MANKTHTVFLVDDDSAHTQMLKDHLSSKLNVHLTTFSSGEDCLNNLHQKPDVVVLDYHLNSTKKEAQNGLEILKKLKAASPETEVIMLSSQDKIEVAVEIMKHGAFDYVIKGESAFVRTQNIILNIIKSFKLMENLKAYKFATYFLSAVIILIVIIAIVLYATGNVDKFPGAV